MTGTSTETDSYDAEMNLGRSALAVRDFRAAYRNFGRTHDIGRDVLARHLAAPPGPARNRVAPAQDRPSSQATASSLFNWNTRDRGRERLSDCPLLYPVHGQGTGRRGVRRPRWAAESGDYQRAGPGFVVSFLVPYMSLYRPPSQAIQGGRRQVVQRYEEPSLAAFSYRCHPRRAPRERRRLATRSTGSYQIHRSQATHAQRRSAQPGAAQP